jgi:hypothetical protein
MPEVSSNGLELHDRRRGKILARQLVKQVYRLVFVSLAFNDSVLDRYVRRGPTYWLVGCPPLRIDLRQ